MNPNPQHIRYFIEAAQQQSLMEAALRFGVSPSAISQSITKLEESLGIPLLTHAKKRFQLSTEGQKALPLLIEHIESLDKLKGKLFSISESKVENIRASTLRSIALAILPAVIARAQQERPDLQLTLEIGHTKDILQEIRQQNLDFAVVVDNKKMSGVKKISLHKGKFCLVIGRSFLKRASSLDWLATQESPGGKELQSLMTQQNKTSPKRKVQFIESWEVIAKFASTGLGLGLIPEFVYESHPHLDLVKIPFPPANQFTYEIVLIARKNFNLSTLEFYEGHLRHQLAQL